MTLDLWARRGDGLFADQSSVAARMRMSANRDAMLAERSLPHNARAAGCAYGALAYDGSIPANVWCHACCADLELLSFVDSQGRRHVEELTFIREGRLVTVHRNDAPGDVLHDCASTNAARSDLDTGLAS